MLEQGNSVRRISLSSSRPMSFSIAFPSLVLLRRGSDRVAWWAAGGQSTLQDEDQPAARKQSVEDRNNSNDHKAWQEKKSSKYPVLQC